MQRIMSGTTLCEGWTWVDHTGTPPAIAGELFSNRRGAIHQAEGTQEEIVYVSVIANPRARPTACIENLRRQRDDLLAALHWYANADNYRFGVTGSYDDRDTMIEMDRGQIARAAIRKAEGEAQR